MSFSPLFCLTADVDWASEFAIADFLSLLKQYDVKATVFATHPSRVLEESSRRGRIEIGIHPNFLPGSSHGRDDREVIDHMFDLFPDAKSFRSHCFVDSTSIAQEMFRRGLRYDCNLQLFLQSGIAPLRHASGLLRFPVFWEDDTHWQRTSGDWNLARFIDDFMSPGLKLFNFHPFNVTANIPHQDYYERVKSHTQTLDEKTVEDVRFDGKGTRTFLIDLLDSLAERQMRCYLLSELYAMFTAEQGQDR